MDEDENKDEHQPSDDEEEDSLTAEAERSEEVAQAILRESGETEVKIPLDGSEEASILPSEFPKPRPRKGKWYAVAYL